MSIQTDRNKNGVRATIAIASGKGGVGKSTVTTQLAFGLQSKGFKVGVIDADIYGPSQPRMLGATIITPKHEDHKLIPNEVQGIKFLSMGLFAKSSDPVIWRGPMAVRMVQQLLNADWQDLDYLLIDMPPGTGDIQITLAQQIRLDGVVIVTTPQNVATEVAERGVHMFSQVNVPIIGIVENMSGFICDSCDSISSIFAGNGGRELADTFKTGVLARIPLDRTLTEASDQGKSWLDYPIKHHSKQALEMLLETFTTNHQRVREELSLIEPQEVSVAPSGDLVVNWKGEKARVISARDLRLDCSCADCIDEISGKRKVNVDNVSENIKATKIKPVGRYGISIQFTDGHNTGIYKFSRLKEFKYVDFVNNVHNLKPTKKEEEKVAQKSPGVNESETTGIHAQVEELLLKQINPALANHGGHAQIASIKDGVLALKFGGGCQGCGLVNETLKNGIEKLVCSKIPEIKSVIDVTDHTQGENPYISS